MFFSYNSNLYIKNRVDFYLNKIYNYEKTFVHIGYCVAILQWN